MLICFLALVYELMYTKEVDDDDPTTLELVSKPTGDYMIKGL